MKRMYIVKSAAVYLTAPEERAIARLATEQKCSIEDALTRAVEHRPAEEPLDLAIKAAVATIMRKGTS
jgi:hypothetical protein